jgi:hypothetical protein
MRPRTAQLENRATPAEREEGLARIPLVRSILNEIVERSRRLLFLEAASAARDHARSGSLARQLHELERRTERRAIARAELELARLDCAIVVTSPLTIQMRLPSGARMIWILG